MASPLPVLPNQFFDNNGLPLVNGLVYTYDAGTSTPRLTWSDAAETVPLSNPIVLDSSGRASIFWRGNYRIEVRNASNVLITTIDNVSTATTGSTAAGGFVNRLINGDMRIDQRNNGAAVTVNGAANFYCTDRWSGVGQPADGVFTLQRQAAGGPTGFVNFLRAAVTTADAAIGSTQQYLLQQQVEGLNWQSLNWGTANAQSVTLSFWVRSSLTGTFSGTLRNSGDARTYAFNFAINAANTWEFKTVTVPGDTSGTWATDTSRGVAVAFDLGSGASQRIAAGAWTATATPVTGATGAASLIATLSATLDLTGVQLESGTSATSFERRSFSQELANCQRYYEFGNYQIFAGNVTTGQIFYVFTPYKVTKRANPSPLNLTDLGSASFPAGVPTVGISGTDGFRSDKTANATGVGNFSFSWTANSDF